MKKLLAGLVLVPLALVGCSGQKPEKDRFIEANKEATCMVLKSGSLTDPSLKDKAMDIFKKHGFDIADKKGMEAIGAKYKDDADVKAAVEQAIKDCGGDLSKAFGEPAATTPAPTDASKTPAADTKAPAAVTPAKTK